MALNVARYLSFKVRLIHSLIVLAVECVLLPVLTPFLSNRSYLRFELSSPTTWSRRE